MSTEEQYRIAVLIDAENVDPSYANQIFTYAHELGVVSVREIYGSGTSLNEWADPILVHSIHTNFTLRPNRFKNSSDICLVIGAMEILASSRQDEKNRIAAVVLASSDSDFSPLAVHLRSAGIDVIGMGEPGHINPLWPRACTDFVPLEVKAPLVRKREAAGPDAPAAQESEAPAQPESRPARKAADASPRVGRRAKSRREKQSAPAGNAPQEKAGSADAPAEENRPPVAPAPDAPDPAPVEKKEAASAAPAPEGEKKAGNGAKAASGKEKKAKSRVAPSHRARVELIRHFIAEQVLARQGRIKSGELFRSLADLPDYAYDQRRSRRSPLDYLAKQYSEWLSFEPGENGSSWISLKPRAAEPAAEGAAPAPAVPEEEPVPAQPVEASTAVEATAAETAQQEEPLPASDTATAEAAHPEETSPANNTTSAEVAQQEEPSPDDNATAAESAQQEKPIPVDNTAAAEATHAEEAAPAVAEEKDPSAAVDTANGQIRQLLDAGIPEAHAAQVAELLSRCRNLRDSYNQLRKAFGNETGKKYQDLIKAAKIPVGQKGST